MRFRASFVVVVCLLASVIACAQPVGESQEAVTMVEDTAEADQEAINALRDQFLAAYNAADVPGVVACFTDDAVVMAPNEPAVEGSEALAEWQQAFFDLFAADLALSSEEVVVSGDWAFDRGTYTQFLTPASGGDAIQDRGKYLVALERQPDGSWKIAREVWNSNNPVPGTEAPEPDRS